jgi:hypothetical protein
MEMERIMPGIVVAGVAGLVGLATQNNNTQTEVSQPKQNIPVVRSEDSGIIVTQTQRGFTPAQDVVCEPSKN